MKKIKVVILVSIIISIIVAVILIIVNNRNTFKLNTKYKYKIEKITVSSVYSDIATSIVEQYYEVDLKNNKVDLREDYTDLTNIKSKSNYSRKLISSKNLATEEKAELEQLLNKIIKENKKQHTENWNEVVGISYYYYKVSNKSVDRVVLDNKEDIENFERIVN